jgi:hypothetical protein
MTLLSYAEVFVEHRFLTLGTPECLHCQFRIGCMNNIEAINYRRPAVTGMPFSKWKEVRLAFLYSILHSLRRAGVRA